MLLERIHVDGRNFYYRDFGNEDHCRNSFRLWVHYSFIPYGARYKDNPEIEFPIHNARIDQGKNISTLILRPDNNYWVTDFFVKCGYRGSSNFQVKETEVQIFDYYIYSSPRGNLGISMGGLLVIPNTIEAVTIAWKKTGRLYGKPGSGTILLHKSGLSEELIDTDICEIEDLAEV